MKKTILILASIICSHFSFSQYESIFGSTSTSWNVLHKEPQGIRIDSLVVCCDTTINSLLYKQIDVYSKTPISTVLRSKFYFVREDTALGKAWLLFNNDTSETLFLDMSLNLNDTMIFRYGLFSMVDCVFNSSGKK